MPLRRWPFVASGNWYTPCALPAIVSVLMSFVKNANMTQMFRIGSISETSGPPRPASAASLNAAVSTDIRWMSNSADAGTSWRSIESQRVIRS